jgi:hypothetical protein
MGKTHLAKRKWRSSGGKYMGKKVSRNEEA